MCRAMLRCKVRRSLGCAARYTCTLQELIQKEIVFVVRVVIKEVCESRHSKELAIRIAITLAIILVCYCYCYCYYSRMGRPIREGEYSWLGQPIREWASVFANMDYSRLGRNIYDTFKEADSSFMTQWNQWEHTHRHECAANLGSSGCPPEPKGPVSLMLEGYKTEKAKICSIGEVLRYPYLERLSLQIHTSFHQRILVLPEQESYGGEVQKDGLSLEPRPKDQDNPSLVDEASETK